MDITQTRPAVAGEVSKKKHPPEERDEMRGKQGCLGFWGGG